MLRILIKISLFASTVMDSMMPDSIGTLSSAE